MVEMVHIGTTYKIRNESTSTCIKQRIVEVRMKYQLKIETAMRRKEKIPQFRGVGVT